MSPLVSVIIPVYNTEKNCLCHCIESIANQSMTGVEVIIVCDGPQECHDVCNFYAEKYNHIRLVKGDGRGVGRARNMGIQLASAEYIMFLDSDDRVNNRMAEIMFNTITNADVDIVACGADVISSDYTPGEIQTCKKYFTEKYSGTIRLDNDVLPRVRVIVWNKIFKKSLLEKYDISFPDSLYNEDALFLWNYLSVASNISFVKEELYTYRKRKDSRSGQILQKKTIERIVDHLVVGEMFFDFLRLHGLLEKYTEAFWRCYLKNVRICFKNSTEDLWPLISRRIREFVRGKDIVGLSFFQTNALNRFKNPDYQYGKKLSISNFCIGIINKISGKVREKQ